MGFRFGYGPLGGGEVQARYAKMENFYRTHGLTIPRSTIGHWDELGRQEISEMKRLGIRYVEGFYLFDDPKHGRVNWHPQPYGIVDLFYDFEPNDPSILRFDATIRGPELDFLEGLTVYAGHSDKNRLEAIIRRATHQVVWGLSHGFFGQLVTHEQKIAVLREKEWQLILESVMAGIRKHRPRFALNDEIGEYTESIMTSRLVRLETEGENARASLKGAAICETELTVARGDDRISLDRVTVPVFEGEIAVNLPL